MSVCAQRAARVSLTSFHVFASVRRRRPLHSPDEMHLMSTTRQELYLVCLVHGVNWIRGLLNIYFDQVSTA